MPHTYYAPPRERKQDDSLQQLTALAQIFGGLNSSGQRAQESQQQNALAVLGLLSQQQHQQAQLALQKSAQADESGRYWGGELPAKYAAQAITQEDNKANRDIQQQNLDNRSGEFWSGTYPLAQQDSTNLAAHQRALEALAQRNADTESGKAKEDVRYHDLALSQAGFNTAAGLPGTTPDMIPALAQGFGLPQGGPLAAHAKDALSQKQADAIIQQFSLIYPGFAKDPTKAQAGLGAIYQTHPELKHPEVWDKVKPFINQQNAALYNPQNSSQININAANVPTEFWDEYGNMKQSQAEQQAAQALQYQQAEQNRKRQVIKSYLYQNNPDYTPAQY